MLSTEGGSVARPEIRETYRPPSPANYRRSSKLAPGVLKTLTRRSLEPMSLAISRFPRRILLVPNETNITSAPWFFLRRCSNGLIGGPKSLPVGHPNVLHLSSMLEEPAAFALLHVEPVNGKTFVG